MPMAAIQLMHHILACKILVCSSVAPGVSSMPSPGLWQIQRHAMVRRMPSEDAVRPVWDGSMAWPEAKYMITLPQCLEEELG